MPPARVLIVDDEKSIRRTLGEFLREEGYAVAEAEDADAALRSLHESPFDVVLSDIILPRVNGVELLRRLQTVAPLVQVVMMTGEPTVETATEALRAGAADYLFKPISKSGILRAVALAARLKQSEDSRRRLEAENQAHRENLELLVAERTAELHASEEKHRTLVEAAFDWVWEVDRECRYTYASPRIFDLLGYHPEEVIGRTPFDFMPLEEAQRLQSLCAQIIARREPFVLVENTNRHRDGHLVVLETSGLPIMAPDGTFLGYRGMDRDVTERKRAEETLRESETRYRQLFESSQDALMTLAPPNWCFTTGNRAALTMFRAGNEAEFTSKSPGQVSPERQPNGCSSADEAAAMIAKAMTEGSHGFEWTHQRLDGETFTASVLLTRLELHGQAFLQATVRDITEQKRAEEQLRKLARAVEQSPASIMITDQSGNIEFVNPKFTQVTGYERNEVLGQNPRFLKSGETSAEEYQRLWKCIAAGQEWHGEFHNRRKDGTLYWERASISPIRNGGGRISHFIAVNEDVTEQKLTQAKLLRAQRVESIGSLASGIAHDLNNILAPIIMCAPMLQSDDSPIGRRELGQMIESSAHRAVGIVKQLLSFARGKEGQKQPVQLRHLLRDMAKIARETFPRSIQIEERCASALWPVLADPTHVHQVLLNLCVNARDAMPTGGKLTLRAHNMMLDDHFVSMHKEARPGPHVRIEVEDTGTGIPDDVRNHIFESFFTTKGDNQGTGLGLATVLGIVSNHRGCITFHTTPGRGTRFEVLLPAAPEAQTQAETAQSRSSIPRGHGELVIVVDDEPAICETTRRSLESQGYTVLDAGDGIEALALFSAHSGSVRAVVTDYMMPLMDGVTLCRTLRRLSPNTPLLVSSGGLFGHAGGEALRVYGELGVRHILHKPHTADVLLRSLAEALHGPSAADSFQGGN